MAEIKADPFTNNGEFLYPAEDAQQILRLAIARETESGELSRAQLMEIAEELGISAATLAEAEQEWEIKRYEVADRRLFDSQRKQLLHSDMVQFGLWMVGVLIFQLATGGWLWNGLILIVFGIWFLHIAWDAWRISHPDNHAYQQEFQRWRRKQQMKRAVGGFVRRFIGPI